jgi:hypothetical protein
MRQQGFTLQQIGDEEGVSRERIRQLLSPVKISVHGSPENYFRRWCRCKRWVAVLPIYAEQVITLLWGI